MRWPRWRSHNPIFDPFYFFGWSGLSRSGNGTGEYAELIMPGGVTVGGRWFDSRIIWRYNVVNGFTIPLEGPSQWHSQSTMSASLSPTGQRGGHGAATGIQRVPGTEGDSALELAQGWGGNSNYGWNMWWGGSNKGNGLADHSQEPPENYSTHWGNDIENLRGGDQWSYATSNNIPTAGGSVCFRGNQGPTFEPPIFTGDDLGPKLFQKTTDLNAPYEVPGAFPNAPNGCMMFQVNLAYWGPTKRTANGSHDSYNVLQPTSPGLKRVWTKWPDPISYVIPPDPVLSPPGKNITDGFAFSYDVKIIGRTGDDNTKLGRYWIDRGINLGFTPILSTGDTAHTHAWDLTNCSAPPDWSSHLRFLIKGDMRQNLHYITNAFMGGPPS